MTVPAGRDRLHDPRTMQRLLIELLALERERLELVYVGRDDALERVADAIRRLGECAPAEGLIARAATELGSASAFGRVMISEVVDGRMAPLQIWSADDPAAASRALSALREQPIALEYPLLEMEVARGRGARIVTVRDAGARSPATLARWLGWSAYAVAAIIVNGGSIGLLHADRPGDPALDELDAEVAGAYADGLAGVCERAVLRHTLELHRAELGAAVQWLGARLSGLPDATPAAGGLGRSGGVSGDARLVASLTARELEVLRLLARGHTNRAIADALVVREGTVKYHVKNILRKLGATSRADAVSRFVRAGAGR
ncbi:MAG: helix-turn-helix transcriptional regulator [Solirubrobacteraceae bacterium]|jgi:DNA-binding CsgD family transcriptional regulator